MKKNSVLSLLAVSSILLLTDCSKKEIEAQVPKPTASVTANAYTFSTGDPVYNLGGNTGYKDVEDLYKASTFQGDCPNAHTDDPYPYSEGGNNNATQIEPINSGHNGGPCTYWYDVNAFYGQCQGMIQLAEQHLRDAQGQKNASDESYYQGYIAGVERGVVDYYH